MVRLLSGLAATAALIGSTGCGQDDLGACVKTTDRGSWCVINEARGSCSGEFTKLESEAAALHCNKLGFTEADHVTKDPKGGPGERLDGDGFVLVADPRKVRSGVERGLQITYRAPSPKK